MKADKELTLKELHVKYPDIKAKEKPLFLKKLAESQKPTPAEMKAKQELLAQQVKQTQQFVVATTTALRAVGFTIDEPQVNIMVGVVGVVRDKGDELQMKDLTKFREMLTNLMNSQQQPPR